VSDRKHDEVRSLLGAYALNAVSAAEHSLVRKHIETCRDCAREVALLTEVAAELSWLPAPEQADDLVDGIVAALPPRPRRLFGRIAVAVAAVSLVVAGFLGAALVRERSRTDDVSDVLARAHSSVRLNAQGGFDGAGSLFVSDDGMVATFESLPSAGRGRSYQLWAITDGKPVSIGVIAERGRVVRLLDWQGRADAFAVTIEPDGGSPVPTSDPVLVSA
jgi:anti-sigma-K factor RskA